MDNNHYICINDSKCYASWMVTHTREIWMHTLCLNWWFVLTLYYVIYDTNQKNMGTSGYAYVCICIYSFRSQFLVNELLCTCHSNVDTHYCLCLCFFRLPIAVNDLLHTSQEHRHTPISSQKPLLREKKEHESKHAIYLTLGSFLPRKIGKYIVGVH